MRAVMVKEAPIFFASFMVRSVLVLDVKAGLVCAQRSARVLGLQGKQRYARENAQDRELHKPAPDVICELLRIHYLHRGGRTAVDHGQSLQQQEGKQAFSACHHPEC